MVALRSLCELLLLRAQDAVVDESVELEPMSVPRQAGSAIEEKAQPLVETPLSLKIPLSWSCGEVPSASGFCETLGLDCSPAAAEKRSLETNRHANTCLVYPSGDTEDAHGRGT